METARDQATAVVAAAGKKNKAVKKSLPENYLNENIADIMEDDKNRSRGHKLSNSMAG